MKLQIFYSNESGSLGNAQRIQQEIDTYKSNGKINTSISSSLEECDDDYFRIVLNEDCLIWTNKELPPNSLKYPEPDDIGLHLEIRNKHNYYKHCR